MNEMVDRLVASLFDALERHVADADGLALQGGRIFLTGDCHFDPNAIVRDLLEAMREPTDDMKRCSDEVHWGFSCAVCGGLEAGWRAMIDAALQPDPTTPEVTR